MNTKKLLIVTNVDWFLISHRLVIAKAAAAAGWKVYVACEDTGRGAEIAIDGIEFIPFAYSRSGTNLLKELNLLIRFRQLYNRIKPDVVHHITLKPVAYGSIAAKLVGVRGIVNAVSGLGYMFTEGRVGVMQKVILSLMKFGAKRERVAFIFQNEEDRTVLKNFDTLDRRNSINLIKGSGVDLSKFSQFPLPNNDKIQILLPCRMLWDKGVRELREATEILKSSYHDKIQFLLVGMADNENKSGVPESYLRDWDDGEYVIWKGHQTNMLDFYRNCDIVVLPSYREGLPKTLIEACAIGRPIVTTDAVGCKDCVDQGVNGFKVPVKDGAALAKALEKLINNRELMENMGNAGRKKAQLDFDVLEVIKRHLTIYNSVVT